MLTKRAQWMQPVLVKATALAGISVPNLQARKRHSHSRRFFCAQRVGGSFISSMVGGVREPQGSPVPVAGTLTVCPSATLISVGLVDSMYLQESQMNDIVISVVPSIELSHGQPIVSSLAVAEHFRKSHRNVVRDIKALDCSERFNTLNFEHIEYTDTRGRTQSAVRMTRNGFMFLVMGYTGPAAARVKEAYIQRFDEMEARYKISANELEYYRNRERELVRVQRQHIRLQRQHIRLLTRTGRPVATHRPNQPDLFGGAA